MVKNEKNLEYLQKLQTSLGFGEKLNAVLESAISRELPKFTLGISNILRPLESKDVNALKTDYIQYGLNFNKQKDGDAYFLNTIDVTLHKTGESVPREQTFDIERDHRITALQAYKLLSGQSLEKDIYVRPQGAEADAKKSEKIKAWFKLQLDVKDAYGNHPLKVLRPEYGYQFENGITKYPLKGLDKEATKSEGLQAMRNGNYWQTELTMGKKTIPVLVAANPVMKSFDIYDKNMKEVRDEEIWPEKAAARTNDEQAKTTTVKRQEVAENNISNSFEQSESEANNVTRGR